jgi:hypothetical protein
VRSPDCLYYVKSGEDGRLEVWKTELTRGGRKKKKDYTEKISSLQKEIDKFKKLEENEQ